MRHKTQHAVAAFAALVAVTSCFLAFAQDTQPVARKVPAAVAAFNEQHPQPTVSADGSLTAHRGETGGIYVRNNSTGEDTRVNFEKQIQCTDCIVNSLAISPDGRHVAFNARWFETSEGNIYTCDLDGSNLVQIAPADPAVRKPSYDMDITELSYSPDGTKLLVRVDVSSGIRYPEGGRDMSQDKTFVGVLSVDAKEQDPVRLAEGTPLFWSTDGKAAYFISSGYMFSRVDISTKQVNTIADAHKLALLGPVPGADAMFVRHPDDASVTALSLDGKPLDDTLKTLAQRIPVKDSDGRELGKIEIAGPHRLELVYSLARLSKDPNVTPTRTEMMDF